MGGGVVVGVNAATGEEMWRHGTWGHAWMGPVVSGDKIFVANASLPRGCGMIQIAQGKPTVLWEDKRKFQTLHCNSVIWQGHIYGFDNTGTDYLGRDGQRSSLKCLQLDTGEVKWVKEKMGWGNLIVAPDRIGGGNLIILREAGDLIVARVSAESYQELSRNKIFDGQSWTVPAFSKGRVYCRNNSGQVVCLQLFCPSTPQDVPVAPLAHEPAKSPATHSAIFANGRVYAVSPDACIFVPSTISTASADMLGDRGSSSGYHGSNRNEQKPFGFGLTATRSLTTCNRF